MFCFHLIKFSPKFDHHLKIKKLSQKVNQTLSTIGLLTASILQCNLKEGAIDESSPHFFTHLRK